MTIDEARTWLQRHADNTPMPGAREAYRTILEALERTRWVPVEERLPENNHEKGRAGDVLCYVPPRDGCFQNGVYLGKLEHIVADDGSGNFWNLKTPASDWALCGWSYFEQPVVTHWMLIPEPPTAE